MSAQEIAAYLDAAAEALGDSDALLARGSFRSAASRGYYAMFYCAEAVLLTKGITSSSHKGVVAAFGKHFVKTGVFPQHLHAWLREAFDKRQIGDYESLPVLTEADVQDLLQKARQFMIDVEAYLRKEGWLHDS